MVSEEKVVEDGDADEWDSDTDTEEARCAVVILVPLLFDCCILVWELGKCICYPESGQQTEDLDCQESSQHSADSASWKPVVKLNKLNELEWSDDQNVSWN